MEYYIDSLEEAKKYAEEILYENPFIEEVFILDKNKDIITRFISTDITVEENWVE